MLADPSLGVAVQSAASSIPGILREHPALAGSLRGWADGLCLMGQCKVGSPTLEHLCRSVL